MSTSSQSPQYSTLGDEITRLAGHINAASYRLLTMIATFDRNQEWGGFGVRSCAHWLNWKCGIDLVTAREKVRVANCLEPLPKISEAFNNGEISYSKVRAMTRVATPENEKELLNIARYGTASHVEKTVQRYQTVKRQLNQVEQYEERSLSYYQKDNGMLVIKAALPYEDGLMIVKSLEAVLEIHSACNNDANNDTISDRSGNNASAESCSTCSSCTNSLTPSRFSQNRADALLTLAEHFLKTGGEGEESSTDGNQKSPINENQKSSSKGNKKSLAGDERYQLMLHMNHRRCTDKPET